MNTNPVHITYTPEMVMQHLSETSKVLADLTANMVYDDPSLLKVLVEVALLDRNPWSQRASWVVSICCCSFPELFKPYSSVIIRNLAGTHVEGVIRNFLKILSEVPVKLTKKDKSILLNLCFDYLAGNATVAAKVYSMQILFNMSLETPEIGIELSYLIKASLPGSTGGYRSRGEKILKKLQRLNFQ